LELAVRDVAKLLHVSENTVYRWVRRGVLPAYRVHNQYRFNRVELQEWAGNHQVRVSAELFAPNGSSRELPSLRDAIERGGIYYQVPGSKRDDILERVSRLPGIPKGIDPVLLSQLLIGRERLASTGVGEGIAIPHPRDPLIVQGTVPVILLCFLKEAVDFRTIDGLPVRVLFILLSPGIPSHLQMLSKLAHALHDETFKGLLHRSAPKEEILARAGALDEQVNPSPSDGVPSVPERTSPPDEPASR
jgi:PTS system nitrogen regulatory IIA component